MKMGIDPVTHKPVSQVLSDLGSISGLPNTSNQMGSVNKDLMSNMLPTKTESSPSQYLSGTANAGAKKKSMIVEHTQEDQVHSWEQQVQYQVINPENVQPHVFSEAASSSSSSSSSNIAQLSSPQSYSCQNSQAQVTPRCSSFDWSEFLHSDPFIWSQFQQLQQCDLQMVMSSLKPSGLMQSEVEISNSTNSSGHDKQGDANEGSGAIACDACMAYQNDKQCEGHSSSGNSFVDGILDRDSEIRAAFPELLDASFDY